MAPTGPRGGGDRRSTPRASRGGGVTKHRIATKKDRDGDVAMDAPTAGGATRGARGAARGPSHGATRLSSRVVQNVKNYLGDGAGGQGPKSRFNRVTFKIYGLKNSFAASNEDGGLGALVGFIERKNSNDMKKMTVAKSLEDGDCVWISVNKEDASGVLRMNGWEFAGTTITVTETTDRMPSKEDGISQQATETKQKLTTVLGQRYNPEQKLLDLSALGADAILSSMGTFDSSTLAEKAFKALVHLASSQYKTANERKEALQAVSIARNEVNDVQQVFTLANSLPELKRLDLSGNKLDSLSKLAKWKNHFRYLEELHLTGNPITEQTDYVPELLQWFPSLQNLNGQQVRTPEEAASALSALLPKPFPQFPSNLRDGDNNVAPVFLQAFFPLFDNDRGVLASAFYDDESWFSLAAIPNSGRNLPWKSYMKYSRNIHKSGSKTNPLSQRLFIGGHLIADLWKALPASRHPPLDQSNQWLIDCHTFNHLPDPSGNGFAMGLFINVHGHFEEADPVNNNFGTRTFSRCFVLGPSKPSNPPPQHPYRVVSDQLTLHNWTPAPEAAAATTAQGPPATSIPAQIPNAAVSIAAPDQTTKNQLIEELSKRTGMTLEYSRMCLDTVYANWNFDLALESFEKRRADLPTEAFLATA